MKFNDIMKEVLDNNKRDNFKEAIEKLVFVDNETAKDAEDILKKYPSATRVKCTRMQRTLLFDNVKDKETAKAQLTDNGMNGLSKQSLSSESFKEGVNTDVIKQILIKKTQKSSQEVDKMIKDYYDLAIRRGAKSETEIANEIRNFWLHTSSESFKEAASYIDTAEGRAKFIKTEVEDKDGKWNDNYQTKDGYYLIHQGDKHHVYKLESIKKESYNASKLKSEYDKLLNSNMTTSDLQSALGVVVKSMFSNMDASYRDEIENILLQGLQASKQFSSIKMSIESKVGSYGLVHGR